VYINANISSLIDRSHGATVTHFIINRCYSLLPLVCFICFPSTWSRNVTPLI